MNAPSKKTSRLEQSSCIDLPGETVNCWGGNVRKIRVTLRKHRDVIFDINLDEDALYSVHSEKDRFYDAIEKKLISPGVEVHFMNGALKHFWISRQFRGALVLKKNGLLVGRYFPGEMDSEHVSDHPAAKPAPLLVTMKSVQRKPADVHSRIFSEVQSASEERFTFVVQLDVSGSSVPREVLEYFMHGSDKELFVSGNVATRNWVFNQIAAQLGFAHDNLNWMKEIWKERLQFKKIRGVLSVVLTGNKNAREFLTANWYGARNAKVVAFSFGIGSVQGLRHSSWGAVKGIAGKGGLASICFVVAIDVAEWLKDYEDRDPVTGLPKRDWNDLFVKIGTDVFKTALGGVLTAAVGFVIGSFAVATAALAGTTIALPVVAICAGIVLLSIAVGFLVDLADQRYGGSDRIREAIKPSIEKLERNMGADYRGFDNALGQALVMGSLGA